MVKNKATVRHIELEFDWKEFCNDRWLSQPYSNKVVALDRANLPPWLIDSRPGISLESKNQCSDQKMPISENQDFWLL